MKRTVVLAALLLVMLALPALAATHFVGTRTGNHISMHQDPDGNWSAVVQYPGPPPQTTTYPLTKEGNCWMGEILIYYYPPPEDRWTIKYPGGGQPEDMTPVPPQD